MELNSNSTKFNSTISLKFNWKEMACMQIGGEGSRNMVLEKNLKNIFPCLFTWTFGTIQMMTTLIEIEIVLPKPTMMNHPY